MKKINWKLVNMILIAIYALWTAFMILNGGTRRHFHAYLVITIAHFLIGYIGGGQIDRRTRN